MELTSYLLGKKQGGGSSTLIEKNITANNTYNASDDNADGYSKVVVNVQPNLETKSVTITENTTTTITPTSGKDGMSSVSVTTNVSGSGGRDWSEIGYSSEPQSVVDGFNYAKTIKQNWTPASSMNNKFMNDYKLIFMPLVDTSNTTNFSGMFKYCYSLSDVPLLNTSKGTNFNQMFNECSALKNVPQFDTSRATNCSNMFNKCTSLESVPLFDTSSVTNFSYAFGDCKSLKTLPQLNTSNATAVQNMFGGCQALTSIPELDFGKVIDGPVSIYAYGNTAPSLGGFKDIGKAYLTTQSANNYSYTINIPNSNLTHDSLMNVINKIYDIATKGCNAQQLIIGSTNVAKLTAEEIAIATNKGWTVS